MRIILLAAGLVLLLTGLLIGCVGCGGSSPKYSVLARELSVTFGNEASFTINPSKVHVFESTVLPIVVHNNSDKIITVEIQPRVADYLTIGYTELDQILGSYCIYPDSSKVSLSPHNDYSLNLTIQDQDSDQPDQKLESWVSFTEVTEEQFRQELCLRILVR